MNVLQCIAKHPEAKRIVLIDRQSKRITEIYENVKDIPESLLDKKVLISYMRPDGDLDITASIRREK